MQIDWLDGYETAHEVKSTAEFTGVTEVLQCLR